MPESSPDIRFAVGCMTGTSIDGIDAALVEISGRGPDMSARFVDAISRPLGELAADLRRLADQQPMPASRIAELSWSFGELHARAIQDLLARPAAAGRAADLVCVHGQTVYHAKARSWQLVQPAPIARLVGSPVVFDLRAADIAAGGQGAPITPLADWICFRSPGTPRAIINLGGFCNVTLLPRHSPGAGPALVRGRDVCACNQLLDGLARIRLGRRFDEDGAIAAAGKPIPAALVALKDLLRRQLAAARSLGTGDELSSWISATAAQPGPDVVRTACEAIAQAIAEAVVAAGDPAQLVLAGGGVRNRTLVGAITRAASARGGAGIDIVPSDAVGVPAAFREATEFAILGALSQDRTPITLPGITGCSTPAPVSGAWVYPP